MNEPKRAVSRATRSYSALREAASVFWGELGAWAYDVWSQQNERYFGGELTVGPIQWGLTPHGGTLGHYERSDNRIMLHRSLRRPKSDAWLIGNLLGERYAADVLLHEMVHQQVHQVQRYAGRESHNCAPWCQEIVRISRQFSVDVRAAPARQRREDGSVKWFVPPGHLTRREFSRWPHSVRPDGFYEVTAARHLQSEVTPVL